MNRTMEDAKRQAAEQRKLLVKKDKSNDKMLATVQAVKSLDEEERWKAYTGDKCKQPVDWRMVTEKTLHQNIPFEEKKINQATAINYIN